MPTNINSIGRGSSERLAKTLSASISDEIIAEKARNGDYVSFSDLQDRVYSVGPNKIEALKEANFVIVPRQTAESDKATSTKNPWRADVNCLSDQTWRKRSNVDMYTLMKNTQMKRNDRLEVDHIIECQLLKLAGDEALSNASQTTRATVQATKELVNSTSNLNVTTHHVNQNKKIPFMKWVASSDKGSLDAFVRWTRASRTLVDEGHWSRIESSVVEAYQELDELASNIHNPVSERFMSELSKILSQMEVEGM
jgi:hypothetical protein